MTAADKGPCCSRYRCQRSPSRAQLLRAIVSVLLLVAVQSTIYVYYRYKDAWMVLPREQVVTRKKNNDTLVLPSLAKGGIVFFVHIPKTGGTTIRELVKYKKGGRRSNVHYLYLTGPREYEHTVQHMNRWVVNGTKGGEVVFVEYHPLDRNCPSFLQMSQTDLPQWRRLARDNGVTFFAFALVREPVSMAISYFNFYHGIPQNPKRFDLLVGETNHDETLSSNTATTAAASSTEEIFVNATIANPQCLFLAHNEDAYTKTGQDLRDSLTHEDCRQAYSSLRQHMDWVGTTETLGNETLPLLQQLFRTHPHTQRLVWNFNKTANLSAGKTLLHRGDLSPATREHIRTRTVWDQELFDTLQRDFVHRGWRSQA